MDGRPCSGDGWSLGNEDGVSCSELRLDHTTCLSCSTPNSFHSSLRVNGTANIGIASQGLVASDQQVWYPSLQQVAEDTVSAIPSK